MPSDDEHMGLTSREAKEFNDDHAEHSTRGEHVEDAQRE
jgi:hypothetical protein